MNGQHREVLDNPPSRTLMMSVDIEELENRLRQEMNEKVVAFERQLRKMQQEYQQNADQVHMMQQQVEQDSLEVGDRREALEQASASERAELTRQSDEIKRVKN